MKKKLPNSWNQKIEKKKKKKAIARRDFILFLNKKKSWVQYVHRSSWFKVSKEPQIFDNTIIYNQKKPLIVTMVTIAKNNIIYLFILFWGGRGGRQKVLTTSSKDSIS